jgi:hypothetical protein
MRKIIATVTMILFQSAIFGQVQSPTYPDFEFLNVPQTTNITVSTVCTAAATANARMCALINDLNNLAVNDSAVAALFTKYQLIVHDNNGNIVSPWKP